MAGFPFASALVTGASAGIGAETARLLGEAGVPTVLVARRRERLEEIASRFDGCDVLEADLSTSGGVRSVVERIGADAGPPDLVVNNAGFGTSGTFHELDVDRLLGEIDVNVKALTAISHAALDAMVPRRRGFLLNVASVVAYQAGPGLAVYAATKAYVQSLTEALHEETRDTGVHVSLVSPGLTATEFQSVSSTGDVAGSAPGFMTSDATDVARSGLEGVARNKMTVVPGVAYKAIAAAGQVLPRAVTRRLFAFGGT